MDNQEAYEKLKSERPVIVGVLRRDLNNYSTPARLARSTITLDDPIELRKLIRQASQHLFESNPE